MAKTSILIPDGESTLTKHVVHCLAMDRDIDIHVVSKDPNASIKHSRLIKSFHVYDENAIGSVALSDDPDKRSKVMDELIRFHHYDGNRAADLLRALKGYVEKTGAQIIFPIDEHIVRILSGHQDEIGSFAKMAPLPEKSVFEMAINKWDLSQFLKTNGVAHPVTVKFSKGADPSVLDALTFPVIIKPIDQGNAQGIYTFQTKGELLTFFTDQKLIHQYIVQPFIDGYDIDCSVLCDKGRIVAYTIQKGIVSSKVRFRAAVGIEFLFEQKVIQVMEKMMALLNWSGVAHVDLRYDATTDEIKVIEINARYWGSLMGSLNAGINFPLLAVDVVNGKSVAQTKYDFTHYFMGKAPIKMLVKSIFKSGREKVRLRDTSLYYTLKDPVPVFFETLTAIRSRF